MGVFYHRKHVHSLPLCYPRNKRIYLKRVTLSSVDYQVHGFTVYSVVSSSGFKITRRKLFTFQVNDSPSSHFATMYNIVSCTSYQHMAWVTLCNCSVTTKCCMYYIFKKFVAKLWRRYKSHWMHVRMLHVNIRTSTILKKCFGTLWASQLWGSKCHPLSRTMLNDSSVFCRLAWGVSNIYLWAKGKG